MNDAKYFSEQNGVKNSLITDKLFYVLLAAGIMLNATGLFSEIMEPDGALYATIAKHIAQTNDWVNLIGDGHDWLDKPHFPFWMAALSFKCFGVNAFAYKFVAFLFWLLGLSYIYRLGETVFNKQVAKLATLIYITAAHAVICNFDVRAEPYLTTLTTGSIYYFYKAQSKKWVPAIMAGSLLAACAVMTKGLFILITIGSGFILYWIITKQWRQLLHIKWLVAALLILLFILPELYCLYVQFDLHPEKIVFGRTHVSGIKFFFWDSQFGRFFNTGPIKGSGDPFFFLHTILWAFLPWSVLLYVAVVNLFRKENSKNKNGIIIYGCALVTFLLFSLSKFQLPHYVIIVFPLFALIVADYLCNLQRGLKNVILLQNILLMVVSVLIITLSVFYNISHRWIIIGFVLLIMLAMLVAVKSTDVRNVILKGYCFAFILHLYLNLFFYPELLKYQGGMNAAGWLKKENCNGPLAMYKTNSYSLEFYAPVKVDRINDVEGLKSHIKDSLIVYTPKEQVDSLTSKGFKVTVLKTFDHFSVSMLDVKFINAETRAEELKKMSLVTVR